MGEKDSKGVLDCEGQFEEDGEREVVGDPVMVGVGDVDCTGVRDIVERAVVGGLGVSAALNVGSKDPMALPVGVF